MYFRPRPAFLNDYPLTGTVIDLPRRIKTCANRIGTAIMTGSVPNSGEATPITYNLFFEGFVQGSTINVVSVSANSDMIPSKFSSESLRAGPISLDPGQGWFGGSPTSETPTQITVTLEISDTTCVRTVDLVVVINTLPMLIHYTLASPQTVPIKFRGNYNVGVDWGDGLVQASGSGTLTLPVISAGLHVIRVFGIADGFDQFNTPILDGISQAGAIGYTMTTLRLAFQLWTNISGFLPNTDWTRNVQDFNEMFASTQFNSPIGNWNTSKAETMIGMFRNNYQFDQDIGGWDVSQVNNMQAMFRSSIFNHDISQWNTGALEDAFNMFSDNQQFNQPIGSWDVSLVNTFESMFAAAWNFNQPLGNWNTSSATNMVNMFEFARLFNQPINTWNVSNVVDMDRMFNGAKAFNQDISEWNVSNVISMNQMFGATDAFNQNLSSWDIRNAQYMQDMFQEAVSLSNTNSELTFGGWLTLVPVPIGRSLGVVPNSGGPNRDALVAPPYEWIITNT